MILPFGIGVPAVVQNTGAATSPAPSAAVRCSRGAARAKVTSTIVRRPAFDFGSFRVTAALRRRP
jgi:hypothetical protein